MGAAVSSSVVLPLTPSSGFPLWNSMARYILRRLILAIPLLLAISLVVFLHAAHSGG